MPFFLHIQLSLCSLSKHHSSIIELNVSRLRMYRSVLLLLLDLGEILQWPTFESDITFTPSFLAFTRKIVFIGAWTITTLLRFCLEPTASRSIGGSSNLCATPTRFDTVLKSQLLAPTKSIDSRLQIIDKLYTPLSKTSACISVNGSRIHWVHHSCRLPFIRDRIRAIGFG